MQEDSLICQSENQNTELSWLSATKRLLLFNQWGDSFMVKAALATPNKSFQWVSHINILLLIFLIWCITCMAGYTNCQYMTQWNFTLRYTCVTPTLIKDQNIYSTLEGSLSQSTLRLPYSHHYDCCQCCRFLIFIWMKSYNCSVFVCFWD